MAGGVILLTGLPAAGPDQVRALGRVPSQADRGRVLLVRVGVPSQPAQQVAPDRQRRRPSPGLRPCARIIR